MGALAESGNKTRPLWQPLSRSPAQAASASAGPVAERLHRQALRLPCSVGVSADDQRSVIEQVREIAAHARQ